MNRPYGTWVREKMVRCTEITRCSICLSDARPRQFLLRLPCGHKFHARCIRRWLETSEECPMCRNIPLFKVFHAVDPYIDGTYRSTMAPITRRRKMVVMRNHRRCRSLFNWVLLELRWYIRHCWSNHICFCHSQPDREALRESEQSFNDRYKYIEDLENYFYILPDITGES